MNYVFWGAIVMQPDIDLSASLRIATQSYLYGDDPAFTSFVCDRIRNALSPSTLQALEGSSWTLLNDGDLLCLCVAYEGKVEIIRANLWSQLISFCDTVATLTNITQIRFSGTDGTWSAVYDPNSRRWIQEFLGV
jgi:hypothetical protein